MDGEGLVLLFTGRGRVLVEILCAVLGASFVRLGFDDALLGARHFCGGGEPVLQT